MTVRHLSEVDHEIVEAVEYYLLEETPQSAERFDELVQLAETQIARQPFLYPIVEGNVRVKLLTPFPFSMLYSVEETEILIIALAHHKKKPGYWRDRL
jgi:toxin ParE1/3/4